MLSRGYRIERRNMSIEEKKMTEVKKEPSITVLILYILYKANILTRLHLKHIFKIIKDPMPENLTDYLVEEVAKST